MLSFRGLECPETLNFGEEIADLMIQRMTVRLQPEYLVECEMDNINIKEACRVILEYLFLAGNGRMISINCLGENAVNYCICAEGGDATIDIYAAAHNILTGAILSMADSVILVHNHPQESACPTKADLETIGILSHAFQLVNINLRDMMIIGINGEVISCRNYAPKYFEVDKAKYEVFCLPTLAD